MKTFRFLVLLPLLVLGSAGFAGELGKAATSATNALAERTVKPAGVRVELPTFDRAIRALVDTAARAAADENPVTFTAPAVHAPELLERAAPAAASTDATSAAQPDRETTASRSAPARHPLRVAGL